MDEIIEAAESVFAERGYASSTMEEIARRAEFAVGTIYKFFPGKSELYAETVLRGFRKREAEVYAVLNSAASPEERIELYFRCRLSQFWENPSFFRLFFQETDRLGLDLPVGILSELATRYSKLKEQLHMIFAEGIRNGQFRSLDPRVLTEALEGLIRAHVAQLTCQVNPPRDTAREEQLVRLFLHGAAEVSSTSEGIH